MRASLPLSHPNSHAISGRPVLHITKKERQVLLDKIAVLAAFLLVLAMLTMSVLYIANELPRWKSGQIGGFEAMIAPAAPDDVVPSGNTAAIQTPAVSRTPLIIISMVIEMVIFVGLGLYLRHEANHLP